mmetsp:Transcript_14095/g.25497  ORF Transcript_14095/g.25497 Transcript_14095/m.25497 type:complete len:83 (-) Transcript_14095:641-889(-)
MSQFVTVLPHPTAQNGLFLVGELGEIRLPPIHAGLQYDRADSHCCQIHRPHLDIGGRTTGGPVWNWSTRPHSEEEGDRSSIP